MNDFDIVIINFNQIKVVMQTFGVPKLNVQFLKISNFYVNLKRNQKSFVEKKNHLQKVDILTKVKLFNQKLIIKTLALSIILSV